jgi:hypothetical protein
MVKVGIWVTLVLVLVLMLMLILCVTVSFRILRTRKVSKLGSMMGSLLQQIL